MSFIHASCVCVFWLFVIVVELFCMYVFLGVFTCGSGGVFEGSTHRVPGNERKLPTKVLEQ